LLPEQNLEKEIRLEELVDNFLKFHNSILHYSYLLLLFIGINTTVNTILDLEWCRILLLMTYIENEKTSHYLVLTCIIAVFSACKGQNKKQNPWNKRIYLQMN
jgi:hypothetical protein